MRPKVNAPVAATCPITNLELYLLLSGHLVRTNAAIPAATGAAIEVPLHAAYPSLGNGAQMPFPGAINSYSTESSALQSQLLNPDSAPPELGFSSRDITPTTHGYAAG